MCGRSSIQCAIALRVEASRYSLWINTSSIRRRFRHSSFPAFARVSEIVSHLFYFNVLVSYCSRPTVKDGSSRCTKIRIRSSGARLSYKTMAFLRFLCWPSSAKIQKHRWSTFFKHYKLVWLESTVRTFLSGAPEIWLKVDSVFSTWYF